MGFPLYTKLCSLAMRHTMDHITAVLTNPPNSFSGVVAQARVRVGSHPAGESRHLLCVYNYAPLINLLVMRHPRLSLPRSS